MVEKGAYNLAFRWVGLLILALVIVFIGARQLGVHDVKQDKQDLKPSFEKEVSLLVSEEQKLFTALDSKHLTRFTIQVASFRDRAGAEKVAGELKNKGYTSTISSKDLGEKGLWHRIFVGNYDSKDRARELLKKIKEGYKDSFITLKQEEKI
ncbi:MAG: SPOR domain-containing protein [bacterium]